MAQVRAGTTGKLAGIVRDAESGEGLPGVNIAIVATHLGTATNSRGEYFILNLPAGTYSISASMIGYARTTQQNIRILPDFTTHIEFLLRPEDLAGEEIVITAERAAIQKDQTMTLEVVASEDIRRMPLRGFLDVVNLGAGIVLNNFRNPETGSGGTNIRGGRSSEIGVIVDGFLQNNLITGTANTGVPHGAVEEVITITGAYDAEYGRYQSGMIQVTTKSGGPRLSGFLEYVNDRPMFLLDKDHYFGYDVYSAGVGGTIVPGRVRFFASTELRDITDAEPSVFGFPKFSLSPAGTKYPDPTKPDSVIFETDSDGHVIFDKGARPKDNRGYGVNSDRGGSIQTKVSIDAIPQKLRVDLAGNYSEIFRRQFFNQNVLSLDHHYRNRITNTNVGGIVTWMLSPTRFADFGVNYHVNSRFRTNDLWGTDFRQYDASNFRGSTGSTTYYNDRILTDINAGVAAAFPRRNKDSYWAAKANYLHQVNSANQIKLGGDFFYHTVRFFDDLLVDGNAEPFYNAVGWRLDDELKLRDVNKNDLENLTLGAAHPVFFSAYAQDKFESEGLIMRGGIRYDFYTAGTRRVKNWADPTGQRDADQMLEYDDLNGNNKFNPTIEVATSGYTDLNGNGNYDTIPNVDRLWAGTLGPEDYRSSRTDHKISLRLGVSFPVSERTQFRMSYGQFFSTSQS
jgi:hypothetical protein